MILPATHLGAGVAIGEASDATGVSIETLCYDERSGVMLVTEAT